ncbi:IPT/TIG domain-containing protein [Paenibacillus glucanolyticus]
MFKRKMLSIFLALLVAFVSISYGSGFVHAATPNYLTVKRTVSPVEITTEQQAEVTLTIKGTPPANIVKPNDVILVIDKSGSMSGEKIVSARNAAKGFIDLMDLTKHQVGIVDYSSSSNIKTFPMTTDAVAAKNYIDTINANGGTATGDAIQGAIDVLANHRPEAQPVIVLLTDGDATEPSGNPYQYALQKSAEAKAAGIVFYTIALLNANDDPETSKPNLLMMDMATTSHHHHFVLGSVGLSEIYNAIVKEIGVASAYDVIVKDTIGSDFELVPGSYENNIPRPTVAGNILSWNFIELKNETLTFKYSIKPKDPNKTGTFPTAVAAESKITYKDFAGNNGNALIPSQSIKVKTPSPIITSITPDKGSVIGGEEVVIVGDKFMQGATVRFGAVEAVSVQTISPTEIKAITPSGVQGTVNVTVRNPDGQYVSIPFMYTAQPTLATITPPNGPMEGGNRVVIRGTNFLAGAKVKFGDKYGAGVVFNNPSYLEVKAPASDIAGVVDVTVENPDGTFITQASGYTYIEPEVPKLEILTVTPNSGLVSGGEAVVINGNLIDREVKVYFGDEQGTVNYYYDSNKIKVITPASSEGIVPIRLVNPNGETVVLADAYTYNPLPIAPPPTISGITPNSGLVSGNEALFVEGTNLEKDTKVFINGLEAKFSFYYSANRIKVLTPAAAAGTYDVVVRTSAGEAVLPNAYTYNELPKAPAPEILRVDPPTGPITGGDKVFVYGKNFDKTAKYSIGGIAALLDFYYDATRVKLTVPAGASVGSFDLMVTNIDGQSYILPGAYTYTEVFPTITAIDPANGPLEGNNMIFINGTNIDPSAVITIGSKTAELNFYYSANRIKVRVPAGDAVGQVILTITNPSGTSAQSTYTYDPKPALPSPIITAVTPTGAIKGGAAIYLNGTDFNKNAVVTFNDGTPVPLNFYYSATRIKVITPRNLPAGPVTIKVINPENMVSNDFVVDYTP